MWGKRKQILPEWQPFNGATYEKAEALDLGSGDGISVRVVVVGRPLAENTPDPGTSREVSMDLYSIAPWGFTVIDPDQSLHSYEWSDAVSYWRRLSK